MSADVIANTVHGQLRGARLDDAVVAFKGVPYAAPPVGPLRFRPPQPVEAWTGVRDAVALPPSCPQPTQRPAGWTQEHEESEDCLYLNVWTPAVDDGGRRPVMVWFHGGGYAIGSGSWPLYDGANLVRRGDVVVITVNHRLGPLGYLHLGELSDDPTLASSGNAGMLDLVAVLEWVRDNAATFGGDAGNVTIFGESGGGAKVSTLLAMPGAAGLFHRAIIQSGPGVRVGSTAGATKAAEAFIEKVGLEAGDVEGLLALSAEQLVAASAAAGRAGFRPVLDGLAVTAHPAEALANGSAHDVPTMIGCNRDEGAGGLPRELDDAGLRSRLGASFGEDHVDEIVATYAELFPQATPLDVLSFVLTDSRMRAGSIQLADAKAKGTASPVFQYFFTYELGGRAGHGYEIAFAFDNLGAGASGTRHRLAEQMSEAWLAFARDGDPNHGGLPKWPAYTPPERATMVFGPDSQVEPDPSAASRDLWSRLLRRR